MALIVNGNFSCARRNMLPINGRPGRPPKSGARRSVTNVKKNDPPGTYARRSLGIATFHRDLRSRRNELFSSSPSDNNRHAQHALLHRPTLIGSHNGELRGQETAISPVRYKW